MTRVSICFPVTRFLPVGVGMGGHEALPYAVFDER